MIKLFSKKNKEGFTLVETIVAISIFATSILAVLVTLTQSISNTTYAKKKMIASYLAQEGIEYMRNMRDTMVLYHDTGTQAGWDEFKAVLDGECDGPDGCYFDDAELDYGSNNQPMASLEINSCSGTCPALLYNQATGKYGYTLGGADTGYVRRIRILEEPSDDEIKIATTVFWEQGSGTYSMTFSESVFNWVE